MESTAHPLIFDLDYSHLVKIVSDWNEPAYRAAQIWQGLYQHLWNDPSQFTSLPKNLRDRMGIDFSFANLQPQQTLYSSDGETTKTLFHSSNHKTVEAVLMRYKSRRTLCISTQSGCAMGCVFCATGQMGFIGHLSSGEIVEQVLYYARLLKKDEEQVTNIVLMGMGEPFHNYDATIAAIDRLNHPEGFNLGARRFTISTVGLVPGIRRFTKEKRQVNLAVSLHAANDPLRLTMLPINKKYPLSELIEACHEYVARTGRRITFEWALIQGVNDSIETAQELARLLKGLICHVNAITLNPTKNYRGSGSSRERAQAFKAELEKRGIPCTVRIRRGIDIQAGCGQLAAQDK